MIKFAFSVTAYTNKESNPEKKTEPNLIIDLCLAFTAESPFTRRDQKTQNGIYLREKQGQLILCVGLGNVQSSVFVFK